MDKRKTNQISRWVDVATHLQKCDDIEAKHKGLCNLLTAIDAAWGDVLEDGKAVAVETEKGRDIRLDTDLDKVYNVPEIRKIVNLLTNHFPEIEVWDKDDAEMVEKREKLLEKHNERLDLSGLSDVLMGMGVKATNKGKTPPESIYYQRGTYRVYSKVKGSDDYKILKALCPHKSSDDDLAMLYYVLLLYLSLQNEKAEVEAMAKIMGVSLQTMPQNAPNLPQNELYPQSGIIVPPDKNRALDVKWQNFLRYVEPKNHKKAERLLQRVIKAGYCNANYEWNASKWKSGKSRLALACFCYVASEYLDMSEKVDAEGRPTTNWQAFETLFEYDGKNQLMNTKKSYMRTNTNFNPPEMIEIKKLFNNK